LALLRVLVAVASAYVLGSLPFGVWVCRLRGRDPRLVGSGRTGGTNVYRTAGLGAALLTVALDILKGFAAVELARFLLPSGVPGTAGDWAVPLAALAAIVGHNYSMLAGFRGGAGTAPNVGAAMAIDPLVFALGVATGALALATVRIASVASLLVSLVFAVGLGWRVVDGSLPPPMLVYAVGQLALVVVALRPNIQRLRAGTERRIDLPWSSRATPSAGS
jgi:glycerol-3-phosphate acyltransferase PlsY